MPPRKVQFDVLALAKATGFEESSRRITKLANDAEKSARSVEQQTKQTHLLSTALLAGASASIPVAGVAAGALVGLGAAAGVAVVGVLGIRDAMKDGTALGRQYQAAFKPVVSEFGQLKTIAAAGLFTGINSGVKSLKPLFPVLNRDVALFSTQMGQVVGHIAPAFVTLFTRINPLFATFGDQLVHGSAAFEHWAKTSDSVGRFVAYIQTTLPQVEQTIGSLITTVSHIAVAAEPFGGTTLTAIRLFSSAINAIPIGKLQVLVPLLLGLKVGNTLSASLGNAGGSLEKFAVKLGKGKGIASEASGVFGRLGGVVGELGPYGIAAGLALGGLSAVLGRSKQAAIEETKRVNDLVQAIQNGTIAAGAWANAQATGAAAATKAGLSQQTITTAIDGSRVKYDQAQKALNAYKQVQDSAALAGGRFGASAQDVATRQGQVLAQTSKLKDALAESRKEYENASAKVQQWARDQGDAALAAEIANGSYTKTADAIGANSGAYLNAKLAADKNTDAQKQATLVMQIEGDTAGLLKARLDDLAGKALSLGEAQTRFAQSVTSATDALKQNGRTVALNTARGQANRSAIEQMAEANRSLTTTQLQGVHSGAQANRIIDQANATFRTNAARIYGAGTAAYKYALTVGRIPHVANTHVRLK